jgi:phenylalanyl-tRNA synthetase alpha chain
LSKPKPGWPRKSASQRKKSPPNKRAFLFSQALITSNKASMSLDEILTDATAALNAVSSLPDLEQTKARFLGKTGSLTEQLKALGKLPVEEKKEVGAAINAVKTQVEALINCAKARILDAELATKLAAEAIDVTLPGRTSGMGGLHPVSRTLERVENLFGSMGFSVADGPEIEDDYYNFTALNTPDNHPARSMHDTFYIEGANTLLRTHTSPVQIRHMLAVTANGKPPIRIICPGRVYRCDHDATHSPMFHQLEGLWVEEGISLADLKGTLTQFLNAFFERDDIVLRFRASYFPFVEPGVEMDMEWGKTADGQTKWLEIGGAGVVHPQVLKNGGVDPEQYSGFAFGMGLDRLAMLKYGVNDLRLFFENDMKFLAQFR